jgi:hypothetical protein
MEIKTKHFAPSDVVVARKPQQIRCAEIQMLLLDLLNPLWPTHFVGYLDNLMAICGISECFEDALLRQMQRPPQNLLATSSRNFDFKLDDWNQMHFCRHMHFVEYLNNLMFVLEV